MHSKNGQSLVEMAVVLPILILILMGIIEFGRIFNAQLILQNLSREGARYAAIGKPDHETIQMLSQQSSLLGSSGSIGITIKPSFSNRTRGESVTVKVEYSIPLLTPIPAVIIQNPLPLSAQTVMRVE
jgi:hypothetical protein